MVFDLADALSAEVFAYLLVFTRIGAGLMVMPGIGEGFVQVQARLAIALLITFLITPLLVDLLPPLPASTLLVFVLISSELLIGLFIGLIGRLFLAALDVAGMLISFNMSLANAFVFNPGMASQGSIPGAFLTLLGLVLIFATNLHHVMLEALVDSYTLFQPGTFLPLGDAAEMVARLVAGSFRIGVQLAAPFMLIGVIFYLVVGILSRLMPQVQIFFIVIPLQVMMGFVIFSLILSAGMLVWLEAIGDQLVGFLEPPE